MILTNTFGANRYKLTKHGLEDKVAEINKAGVELARRVVAASFKDVFVAGDVGPLGVRIAPYGRVSLEEARAAFAEQIRALAEAGADLIVIETISDLYEIKEAVRAARDVGARSWESNCRWSSSVTFTRDDVTLLGDNPAKVARTLAEEGADVIGVNCSGGPSQLLRLLKAMREALPLGAGLRLALTCGSSPTPGGRSRSAGASCIRPRRITSAITRCRSARRGRASSAAAAGRRPRTSRRCARHWTSTRKAASRRRPRFMRP